MADSIVIRPSGPIFGSIRPPGSKSLTNRALVCAALADGPSVLSGALDSEDTGVMIDALGQLGVGIAHDRRAQSIRVQGCRGHLQTPRADLYVAASGTTMRFLTALVSLGRGAFRLDGTARMRARPIQDLLDAMQHLGVDARSELGNGCPPVIVSAAGLRGGVVEIAGSLSSQFLSGLLMAAPYAAGPIRLVVDGELVSKPFVRMTCGIMARFGVAVECRGFSEFLVPAPTCYRACDELPIEPDATAASYFLAAAAITGGRVTVEGLTADSVQGDLAFVDCLSAMGCRVENRPDGIAVDGAPGLHGIETDMNAISDTVQTLAAVALFAAGPTTIRGVAHIRHKETDRLAALACELRKFGAEVEEMPDGLRIVPGPLHGAEIDTYDDHRMAMSLALVGLRVPEVVIRDPDCTRKTYPEFFRDLERLRRGT